MGEKEELKQAPVQDTGDKKGKGRSGKNKNLIFYPLGTVGRDMMYCLFNNYILTYIMLTKQLTKEQLMAISGIMVAARVFDALNDPIMGNIIEQTRTKWGKFKPWLLVGVCTTSVVIYLAFNSKLQGWSFITFFGIIYFAYSITYTMHDISYWGMIPALSRDADLRNQFTSRATLFAGIGSTLASVLIPALTVGEDALGGSAGKAYGMVALAIALIGPLFMLFTLFGVREDRDDEEERMKLNFRRIFRTITQNDQLRWMIVIFLLQQIANQIVLGGIGSYYIYFRYGYEGNLYAVFSIVGVAATAVLMLTYPMLSRRFQRKQLMTFGIIMVAAGSVLELIAGYIMPADSVSFYLITVGYMIVNVGLYGFYLIMMISIINTVEYNEYTQGTRDEAIITPMRPFLTKLASALVVLLTSLTYLIRRVTSYTNRISDLESQVQQGLITEAEKTSAIAEVLSSVDPAKTTGLLLSIVLIPFIFMLASYLLYRKHYTLDEDEYARICTELEKRKR